MKRPQKVTIKLLDESGIPFHGLPVEALRPIGQLAAVLLGCTEDRVGFGESDSGRGWTFHVMPPGAKS